MRQARISEGQPIVGIWYGCATKAVDLHLFGEEEDVAVVDAQAPLGEHDAALALDDFRLEREVRQPVRFEIENEIEGRTREQVQIDRDVAGSEGVVRTTLRFPSADRIHRARASQAR